MKKVFLILLVAAIVLTSCKKEDNTRIVKVDPAQSLFSQLTYLSKLSNDFYLERENTCKYLTEVANKDIRTPEVLDEEAVKTHIDSLFDNSEKSEKFLSKLKETLEKNNFKIISEICQTENSIYVTLSENTEQIRIATWESEDFAISEPIAPLVSFVYMFAPEYLEGEHLIHRGYGEEGSIWWTFYSMDPETQELEIIEDCTGGFSMDEENKFIPEEFSLKCELEYQAEG